MNVCQIVNVSVYVKQKKMALNGSVKYIDFHYLYFNKTKDTLNRAEGERISMFIVIYIDKLTSITWCALTARQRRVISNVAYTRTSGYIAHIQCADTWTGITYDNTCT